MTTQHANAIYDLDRADVIKMINQAMTSRPKLKRPSVLSFKSVLAYIGHRDRFRNKAKTEHYCDDSLDQIADALGFKGIWKAATIADVVAMATHLGIVKTVRAGGKDVAARRTINLERLSELVTVDLPLLTKSDSNGDHPDSYGDYSNSYGDHAHSNGVSTATPITNSDPQRTAPLSAAVRDDVTNSGGDFIDALDELVDRFSDDY